MALHEGHFENGLRVCAGCLHLSRLLGFFATRKRTQQAQTGQHHGVGFWLRHGRCCSNDCKQISRSSLAFLDAELCRRRNQEAVTHHVLETGDLDGVSHAVDHEVGCRSGVREVDKVSTVRGICGVGRAVQSHGERGVHCGEAWLRKVNAGTEGHRRCCGVGNSGAIEVSQGTNLECGIHGRIERSTDESQIVCAYA